MSSGIISRAVVYTRKSTLMTDSIESQIDACVSTIHSEYGEVEIIYFSDAGLSGSLGIEQRHGLKHAVESLDGDTVLVAVDVSRLARSIYVQLEIERAVSKAGATLHLVDTGVFGLTPENELQSHMLAAFAEYYRQATRHKIKSALALKKKNGQQLGRPRAFCRFNDKHTGYEITEMGLKILAIANHERTHGATWKNVADKLNSMHVVNTKGAQWTTQSIRLSTLSLRQVA